MGVPGEHQVVAVAGEPREQSGIGRVQYADPDRGLRICRAGDAAVAGAAQVWIVQSGEREPTDARADMCEVQPAGVSHRPRH